MWKQSSKDFKVTHTSFTDNTLSVTYALPAGNQYIVNYTFGKNGSLHVGCDFKAADIKAEVPRIGVRFRLPAEMNQVAYFGRGPEENYWTAENEIDVVIFDDELSPSQTHNIEKALGRRITDRTRLILDIFVQRAQTAYAKTQVKLAQYEYMLPRLTGMWTHLERQRGGTGTRGGAGEREIETDRRVIRNNIAKLKEDLKKTDRQMAVQRSNRGSLVRVSLVGYTNVGKSTLMNLISKSDVFAENKLFATLDTTVRKVVLDNLPFLLSDTVGFIRKLPTQLVESVQIDAGRGTRGRPAAPRGGHFTPQFRRTDSGSTGDAARNRGRRQTGLHGFQQGGRLPLQTERGG